MNRSSEVIFNDNINTILPADANKVFIIDNNVYRLYKTDFKELVNSSFYLFEAEEKNKILTQVRNIYDFFQNNNVNRSTVIIGIGGGITTDITSFAASTYMRGCRLILIPTTFLAMIDAAIGGKTAVNYNGIKNNIGTFFPAEKIIISTDFLKTLPEKEMKNGWAECLKMSLIKKSSLYDLLLSKADIKKIIKKTIELKLSICMKDPEDRAERRLLNLGHTFAHIIESISDFKISHGTAVSVGIRAAAKLSYQKEFIDNEVHEKIVQLLDRFDLAENINSKFRKKLLETGHKILLQDKKRNSSNNLILFRDFQDCFVHSNIDPLLIMNILLTFIKVDK